MVKKVVKAKTSSSAGSRSTSVKRAKPMVTPRKKSSTDKSRTTKVTPAKKATPSTKAKQIGTAAKPRAKSATAKSKVTDKTKVKVKSEAKTVAKKTNMTTVRSGKVSKKPSEPKRKEPVVTDVIEVQKVSKPKVASKLKTPKHTPEPKPHKTTPPITLHPAWESQATTPRKPREFMTYQGEPYQIKPHESYMNEQQLQHFRRILNTWKTDLMREVDNTISDMKASSTEVLADLNDRATQEETFALKLRARDRERKLLKKIEEALQQIDDKEYGYCESCGVEIGIRRLEARPTAALCIDCKTLDEIREKRSSS